MNVWIDVFIFVFGTIIGSFLNVVAYRYGTGYSLTGRSGCLICGKTLHWYELIPILSFFVQRGRCRKCRCLISPQYPMVETIAGVLFLLAYRSALASAAGLPALIFDWPIWSLLLLIVVYDIRHQIIPNGLAYAFAGFAFLRLIYLTPSQIIPAVITAAALFAFFFLLWAGSKGRWMGFGDAKLAVGIGLLLGPTMAISATVLAFWSGAIVGLLMMFVSKVSARPKKGSRYKTVSLKTEIPFAPFLILGVFIAFFLQINVLGF